MDTKATCPPPRPCSFPDAPSVTLPAELEFWRRQNAIEENPVTPRHKRQQDEAIASVLELERRVGINHIGFLTLTFSKIVTWDFASAAFKKATPFLKKIFPGGWVRVFEFSDSGRLHIHLVAHVPFDLREGFNFAAYEEMKDLSRLQAPLAPEQKAHRAHLGSILTDNPRLKNTWKLLNTTLCEKYGFGRAELAPVIKTAEAVSKYAIEGWLHTIREKKTWRVPKGARIFAYCKPFPRVKLPDGPGKEIFQQQIEIIMQALRLDEVGLVLHYGKKWRFFLMRYALPMLRFWLGSDLIHWDLQRVRRIATEALARVDRTELKRTVIRSRPKW